MSLLETYLTCIRMYWVVATLQADCLLKVLARYGYGNDPIGSKAAVLVICMAL